MFILPSQNKKYSITNNSDLFGNIHYTKNMNFDESGYVELSPRAISVQSEDITGNIHLPLAFGRKNDTSSQVPETEFAMVQSSSKEYWTIFSEELINFNIDSDGTAPTLSENSHGKWFNNSWHVTTDTELWYKDDNAIADVTPYTEVTDGSPANLTNSKPHILEVFKNRKTLCVSDGNLVLQYESNYTASTTLTLPSDLEVIGLAYSNYRMGVITQNSSTASGQNSDAFFFEWNGSTTSAQQGVPVGTDKAIAIVPYMGTWVVLIKTGQLLIYTGGGFKELTAFPFSFKNLIWGDSFSRDLLGDVMQVDGDLIYININGILSAFGSHYEQSIENCPAGIWCYDPEIGLYHRASPSTSRAGIIKVEGANINTTTNVMTVTTSATYIMPIPSTGSPIKYVYDKTNHIGGLKAPNIYYCIKESSTTFKLAESKEKALAGVAIDLTSTGATNNYFLALEVYDFGQSIANKSGAIGMFDTNSTVYKQMIFGAELPGITSTSYYNHVNVLCDGFENRGYLVTSKMIAEGVEDNMQGLFLRWSPLGENDAIVVKYKNKDIYGLPITTPQMRSSTKNQCTWSSDNSFYTTADISVAKTHVDNGVELECEIIGGAGAGNMVKIDSIEEEDGTYVVTLAEDVIGASGGRYCDIRIDNWVELETITSSHNRDWKYVPVGAIGSWFKFKIELRGSETRLEQATFINKKQLPLVA